MVITTPKKTVSDAAINHSVLCCIMCFSTVAWEIPQQARGPHDG
jgi:hypothetical protein